MPVYIYAHFSLSRDNQILKFIISTLEMLKVYNKYGIKPEKLTFCHYNDILSCIIIIDAFLKFFFTFFGNNLKYFILFFEIFFNFLKYLKFF